MELEKNNNIISEKYKIVKCCILGDTFTGKTTLFNSMLNKSDSKFILPTIGVDFGTINIEDNNEMFKIQIWDTAGQEKFRSITKNYVRDIFIILLVFDLNNISSFKNLQYWLNEIKFNCSENAHMILIGNKIDKSQTVQDKEILEFVKNNDCIKCWFKLSSNNDAQVKSVITQIIFYANKFIESYTPITENFVYDIVEKYTDGLYLKNLPTERFAEIKTGNNKTCSCVIM